MVQKFLKFIEKSKYKDKLLEVIKDIYYNNLDKYDVKPLSWKQWHYRIRVGSVRIIFVKTSEKNLIVTVDNRGDIY